jgi:phenylalanyl-tRNA synthetase beta chain
MPTVKFSKKCILESLGRKISDEQLLDRIAMLGTGIEGVDGDEISIEVSPNRPDLLSVQGLARALSSFLSIKTGLKKYIVKKSSIKVIIDKSVKDVRPFTVCAVVRDLKLTDERIRQIIQIQEKLHITHCRNRKKASIGIYPLEHIRPPIYYKALHPEEIRFKPLDLNKDLNGAQILAIHPTGREYGYLLEGLDKYPVFIDSKMQFMSMPPIINSNSVGKVDLQTRDVFIECSGFDFGFLHSLLNIIVTSLADMGGEIYSVELTYPDKKRTTPALEGIKMELDTGYVNKILGLSLKESQVKSLLEMMGYNYKNGKAVVPAYRTDVLHPIDLVEDIAIAYGYDKFSGRPSTVATSGNERRINVFENKIRDVLVGAGLLEVKNCHLTNKEYQTKLMNSSSELVELENPSTAEYNALRTWLLPCLMESLKYNKLYEYPQNIFEIGAVFKLDAKKVEETGVHESERLSVLFCGQDANFTKIKQLLDALMESLNAKYSIADAEHSSFIHGRVGRVVINDEKIAYIGELHPQVIMNWSLEMPVAALELNISDLFRIISPSVSRNTEINNEARAANNNNTSTKNTICVQNENRKTTDKLQNKTLNNMQHKKAPRNKKALISEKQNQKKHVKHKNMPAKNKK